jgi:hypothetical protein
MLRHLAAAAALCLAADAASATPFTYEFNLNFDSYSNNSDGSTFSFSPGGLLQGSLTLDDALSGDAAVLGYQFTSNLPGPGDRTSAYDFGVPGNFYSFDGDILSLRYDHIIETGTFAGATSQRETMTLDFADGFSIGDSTLTFDGSERYIDCFPGFFSSGLQSNCTGLAGTNGGTGMTASLSVDGEPGGGGTGAEIPLPAALPLMGLGLAALGVAARRRRT